MAYRREKRPDPLRSYKLMIAGFVSFVVAIAVDHLFVVSCDATNSTNEQPDCSWQPAESIVWLPVLIGVFFIARGAWQWYRDYYKGAIYW